MEAATVAPFVALIAGACLGIKAADLALLLNRSIRVLLVKRTRR